MADTLWFDKKPGDEILIGPKDAESDDCVILLVPGNMPDWVRTPEAIGGDRMKPIRTFMAACPLCMRAGETSSVKHLECTGENQVAPDENVFVAECTRHGFTWYRK